MDYSKMTVDTTTLESMIGPSAIPDTTMMVPGSLTYWEMIIRENEYINKNKTSGKDEHSFCRLVDVSLTQSHNITHGISMEKMIHDAISKITCWVDINTHTIKGDRQKDHIWLNRETT